MRVSRIAGSALSCVFGMAVVGCASQEHTSDPEVATNPARTEAALRSDDADGDGVADAVDNCPALPNADQTRIADFGPGDACRLSLSASSGLLGRFARFQSHKELVTLVAPFTLNFGPDLMRVSATGLGLPRAHFSPLTQRLGVQSGLEFLPGDADTIKKGESIRIDVGSAALLGSARASAVQLRIEGSALLKVNFLRANATISSEVRSHSGTSLQRFALPDGAAFDGIVVSVDTGSCALRGPGEVAVFTLGDAVLDCPSGEHLVSGRCEDIDECAGLNHTCDPLVTCVNTPGSFRCGPCPSGYAGTGNTSCIDVDECANGSAQCSPLVACSNTVGGFACGACPSGYRGDGHSCVDVDECAEGSATCDAHTTCTNRPGGYDCGSCPSGYAGTGATGCLDVDECALPNGVCDALTACTNTQGSYTCAACPAGYRGTGDTSCVDVDECADGSATCSSLVTCTNRPGGYVCGDCPHGYAGDGRTCNDVDECARDLDDCSALTVCTNVEGGYLCGACPAGYVGDGHICNDIDECTAQPCDARVACTNTPGNFVCAACPPGFTGDGYTGCVDIDECAFENGGCASTDGCSNSPGAFHCVVCPGVPDRITHCGVGACARNGVTSCTQGAFADSCAPGAPAANDALCNGVDDDCDGSVDEDFVNSTTHCGGSGCAQNGVLSCVAGVTVDSCTLPPAGAACDDGNACNGRDQCNASGSCVSVAADVAMCCPSGVAQDSLAGTGVNLDTTAEFAQAVEPMYIGPFASQLGVQTGALLPAAVSVIRGRVLSSTGQVLSCATISLPANPSVGSTLTRGDGRFAMLINGGPTVTLRISAAGFTAVNVSARVKENRVLELSDVRLRP